MTRQINSTAKKNKMSNRTGRRDKPTLFFHHQHFANEPTFKNNICWLTACVTGWRAWTRLGSGILFGRRKCLNMPQNPASQVHAVLGGVSFLSCLLGFQKLRQEDNLRLLTQEHPQIAGSVIAFHLRGCDRQ